MLYEISGRHTDECDNCHHDKPGCWYEDEETGVEWFYCDDCKKKDDEKEAS